MYIWLAIAMTCFLVIATVLRWRAASNFAKARKIDCVTLIMVGLMFLFLVVAGLATGEVMRFGKSGFLARETDGVNEYWFFIVGWLCLAAVAFGAAFILHRRRP